MRDDLEAIDFHVHPWDAIAQAAEGVERYSAQTTYFNRDLSDPVSLDELADQYRGRRMMAVLLGSDDSTTSGLPPIPNDHIFDAVEKHPDVFVGFGSVDPWQGKLAVREVRRMGQLGLRGLKFNPGRQHFFPNDERFYPLWAEAQEQGMICLFHTGMMGNGAGVRGGLGFKLKYVAPIPYIDDIAADFPELTIVSAHPAWPWQQEQMAVARHKGNVFMDLSGWSPKYFAPELVKAMNSILQDKVLFGSDWPMLTVERWLADFAELDLRATVRRKILLENAKRLLWPEG